MFYEYHSFTDEELKIIYHIDTRKRQSKFGVHLHRNVELLLMKEGTAEITSDSDSAVISAGELAIIAPNKLHRVTSISEACKYYCLIIDHSMYEEWFSQKEIKFPLTCCDAIVAETYLQIFDALTDKKFCYRQETKALIMRMLAIIFRLATHERAPDSPQQISNKKLDMVRKAITYMYQNFSNDISMDDICREIGFSKYYFCRSFKEITGQTPLWHLNYIRCQSARALLCGGDCSITECAIKCGFNNTSYFCKTYKKYFGNQPKDDYRPKR